MNGYCSMDAIAASASDIFKRFRSKIKQVNGQRIFRPFWNDEYKPMEPGCEIFVGRLPRDAFEGELIPLFAALGQMYECRLMMDFSGLTRGFCYVTYTTKEMADAAVKFLHGYCIRPTGEKIYCYHSLDNRRLYLEGVPTDKTPTEIEQAIRKQIPGIYRVILYCVGIGFIEFINHRYAANCRKNFWPAKLKLWDTSISVEWAVPLPSHTKNNLLLIKNLCVNQTKSGLVKDLLKVFPGRSSIVNVYKRSNYAIIQFLHEKDSVSALSLLQGKLIGGKPVITRLFDMTEEGEEQLLLELQMCENSVYGKVDIQVLFPFVAQPSLPYHVVQTYKAYRNASLDSGNCNLPEPNVSMYRDKFNFLAM